jgi:hypothetical protein
LSLSFRSAVQYRSFRYVMQTASDAYACIMSSKVRWTASSSSSFSTRQHFEMHTEPLAEQKHALLSYCPPGHLQRMRVHKMLPGRPRPGRSIVFKFRMSSNLHLESNTSTRMIPFRCAFTPCVADPNTRDFQMLPHARATHVALEACKRMF